MQLAEPESDEYLPAAQFMQSEKSLEPVNGLYLPLSHDAQCLSSITKTLPAAHVDVQLVPTSDEYLPGAHSLQSEESVEPVTVWNLPDSHPRHACEPMIGAYFPAAHHKHIDEPLSDEYLPGTQSMQSEGDVEPVTSR